MQRTLIVALVCLGLLSAPGAALAGGYKGGYGGGYGYKGGYGYYGYKGSSDGYYYGIGVIAGAILLGALLSRPAYQAPPRVVYVQPVPPGTCVQDQVYRTLPDGRIQTGTRTRCY